MKTLLINESSNGQNTFCIPKADSIAVAQLGSNKQVTVPAGANKVVFASTDDFWMNVGAAVTVPAGDTLTPANGPELNPTARSVNPGDVINVNGTSGTVCMAFYA